LNRSISGDRELPGLIQKRRDLLGSPPRLGSLKIAQKVRDGNGRDNPQYGDHYD
jgi:hypothetical protein